ncbi:MAG: MobC family plasmid mobilization relaxosome protein [Richelia sp. RM2_1_2]|nr:MobC family plasmid mobilization relaxosome protein [Richelia sp. SM1_7_0]NJN11088.1 MobC family plasmid mobilization relaxosome protein [Richelia sp. RM1_1_1]NJO59727.1 MobC family plasmid mobilization relaxosome protein [Richelia sp. RM2_1_2]
MPRPRKSKATKRTHHYSVWLSDLELDWLRMKANDAGVPQSVLIRRLTLGKPLPKRISKISLKTYQELTRIGNNLNQLTKASNAAIKMGCQPPVDSQILNELLDVVNKVGRQLTSLIDCDEDSEELDEDLLDDWEAEER